MSEPKETEELREVVKGLEQTYNDIVISMVARVQEGLNLIESMENLKNTMPSRRVQDLNTLYCLQSLMEAQIPVDKEKYSGEETRYESALNADSLNKIADVIGIIVKDIKSDYKTKKEDGR